MHDGGWFWMGGMTPYWSVPLLILVVLMAAWMFSRRRSRGERPLVEERNSPATVRARRYRRRREPLAAVLSQEPQEENEK